MSAASTACILLPRIFRLDYHREPEGFDFTHELQPGHGSVPSKKPSTPILRMSGPNRPSASRDHYTCSRTTKRGQYKYKPLRSAVHAFAGAPNLEHQTPATLLPDLLNQNTKRPPFQVAVDHLAPAARFMFAP